MQSSGVSQSLIVQRSGISRAQLSRLVAGDGYRVRQGTLNRLAGALGVSPDELVVGGAIPRYKRWLFEETSYVDFRGFGMPSVQRQLIREVFVEPEAEEVGERGSGGECQEACSPQEPRFRDLRRRRRSRVPATACVRSEERTIILGEPGGGKTTLLRFLANSASAAEADPEETPIYVRLPDFCRAQDLDEGVDLVKFLAARAAERGCPDIEAPLKQELADEKRRCLVLLDGLDEVGTHKQRDRLIESVQAFVEKYPSNRYVVTSRPAGFDSTPWRSRGFSVFRIRDYDRARLERFAKNWAGILSRTENKPHAEVWERLNRAIFANPRVRALASNPLIVTIFVLLNEARGGVLPRRRVDLYEKVADVFLDTWEGNKRSTGKFEDTRDIDLDAREFRWLLSDLSLSMQKAERTLAPRWWIAEKIEDYLQHKLGYPLEEAKDVCDRIIRYLAERTGLIEERGLGLFAFSHRTLQEYFASRGVIDEADASLEPGVTGCLRGYYFHPQWPEVVRLVAAQLSPPLAESLLVSILDDPDPVGRFLRRGHLLALRCLSDGASIANRRFVSSIFDSLAELGRSRWLGITLDVIDVLEGFVGTRLEESACSTVELILATAKDTLDGDEYDCLRDWARADEVLPRAQEQLPANFRTEVAAREVSVNAGDAPTRVFHLNNELLSQDPAKWHASASSILADPTQSLALKELLVREMSSRVLTDYRCRARLRETLNSSMDASLRATCARALASAAVSRKNVKQVLLRTLMQDANDEVKHACAVALKDAAERDPAVTEQLVVILASDSAGLVRSGAATGLTRAALSQTTVREALEKPLVSDSEPDALRIACACALDEQMRNSPVLLATLQGWLQSPSNPRLARIGAQLLTSAMAEEKIDWNHVVVEKAEGLLLGLESPCPCALESLEALATAREVHHGLRFENVLRESLRPLTDSIELAFVFGSVARDRQTQESDIDLLLIGNVTLKMLSGPLRQAEKMLGRRISPAIYTRDAFCERYQRGDPFLLEVYRREKIPVIGGAGKTSRKDVEDELRTMVAERMAATA
jgi:predicted nucleotidyltransferase/transcriptional regulator with XRE-family HTH domain